ncbi:hypothetical protein [Bacteroides heparinolyticus]|uniref:hypothetical protein n=1 Tax=Prevotella heparinolytica TaxID=28113 RepID=UPI00359F45DB
MTRNTVGRLFSLATLGFVVCVAFFSCAKENPREESPEILSEETRELQKAFMREYREYSLRSDAMRDSIFGFEGLKPQWQSARSEVTGSGIRFTEVPLNADLAALPVSSSLSEHLDACEGKTVNLTYLIRKEHPTDSTRSLNYFISMMPSYSMLTSGSSLAHRPGAVPDGFDGEVLFFNLKGEIRHKYVYENAILIRRYRATYRPQMRMSDTHCMLVTYEQDRYYYVVDSDGTASEPKYNYTRRSTEILCFTSMDFASEMKYDEHGGGGGGGGGGSWGRPN